MNDRPKLFTPDTLNQEYHDAFSWARNRGAWNQSTLEVLDILKRDQPISYTALSILAHEGRWRDGSDSSFREGLKIVLDLIIIVR